MATLYPGTFDALCRKAQATGDGAGLPRRITPGSTLADLIDLIDAMIAELRAVDRHADIFGVTPAHGTAILGVLAGLALACRHAAEAGGFVDPEPAEAESRLADVLVPASASRCEQTVGELIEDGQVALADLQSALARLQRFAS